MACDILASIGEALIDFIPDKKGCEFSEVTGFAPSVGGAPANVCGAFSKLGGKSKMLTQLGDDPFGHKILKELSEYGIDTSDIKLTSKANTALAFVSLSANGNRTFSFYRNPSADMLYSADDINEEILKNVFCLHFCSVSLGNFPMKDAHIKAIDILRSNGGMVSFDLNLRFQLWDKKEDLLSTVNEFIPYADIIKVSDEELEFVTGEKDIQRGIEKLFRGNVKLVVYTCGGNGAYVFTKYYNIFDSVPKVNVVDTTGAGDGFIGSFLWKFKQLGINFDNLEVSEELMKNCLVFANQFCTYSVQHKGAIASYPTYESCNELFSN